MKYLNVLVLGCLAISGCKSLSATQLLDGDIIFHTSRSAQSLAIQRATHSRYSHMGIIFHKSGEPYVYEAIRTVQYTPLKKWIVRGDGGHYVVKRLQNTDKILNPEAINRLKKAAAVFQGKPYDMTFEWSDARVYCSELVWKSYDRALGLHLGRLQKLREFDLSDPIVKAKIRERYGNAIPKEEPVISPGEMFSSRELIVVSER
jgi:hypothetical protein